MKTLLLIAALAILGGCAADTRAQHHERTDVERSYHVRGTVSVPIHSGTAADGSSVPMRLPIDVTIDGGGADETDGESKSHTEQQGAKLVASILAGELAQRFPALAAVGGAIGGAMMSPAPAPEAPWYKDPELIGGLAVGGLAVERHLAAGRAKKREDNAWDQKAAADVAAARASKGDA